MAGSEFDKHAANYSSAIEETIGVFGQGHNFYVRHKAILLKDAFAKLPARAKSHNSRWCQLRIGNSPIGA